MNAYATGVVSYLLAQSWQVAILAATVGLVSFALRNRSAHLRYLLWLIVLAKCLVPPFLTVPLAVLPERSSSAPLPRLDTPDKYSAPEAPILAEGTPKPHEPTLAMPSDRELVALVWMAGTVLFLVWVGGRAVRYTAWLRRRRKVFPPPLQESIQELSAGFKFRRWPTIWLLEDISQPFVWGLLRGDVYLPARFAGLADSDQQRSILAHELGHVARFDAGVNLLQVLAQAAYWFHPLVWWANRKIRQEREKCCDEMAVAHLNAPPEHYTGAIIDALAAERRSAHPIPSLAIVGSVRDIEERIKTMLKPGKTFRRRPSLVAATVASLIALATIPTALVLTARGQAQPPTQTANQPAAHVLDSDPPRYAARTFNSKMALDVFVQNIWPPFLRSMVGRTPSDAAIEIPACWVWLVRPREPVTDWDLLIREMSQNNVPGLVVRWTTDADLKPLAGFTALQFLDLDYAPITDESLAHLEGLTGLWGLTLQGAKITGPGIEHLKGLPGLQYLDLSDTPLTDAGMQYLKDLKQLQGVRLTRTEITGAGLEHLKGMSGLRGLHLRFTRITDGDLVHLEGLSELQVLDLIGTEITGSGFVHLKGLMRLQELNLCDTKVTDSGLANLAGLTWLKRLWLDNAPVTDAGLAHLVNLTGLQNLGLRGTQVTDATMARLVRHQTGLRQLTLGGTRITDAGLEHLKGLTKLKEELELGDTWVTDAGMEYLKGLTELEGLDLSRTGITDAGLAQLKGLTRLEGLSLADTKVTYAGIQQLKQSLPKLQVWPDMGPSGTQSGGQSAESTNQSTAHGRKAEQPRYAARTFNSKMVFDVTIAETRASNPKWIGKTPSVAPIEIPACDWWRVQPKWAVQDWDSLIREMNQNSVPGLSLTQATDSDVRRLAEIKGLRSLELANASITDAALTYIAGLPELWALDLTRTKITDVGLEHLQGLTGLQRLRLSGTQITDAGLAYLKGMTGLQVLWLYDTAVTDAGLAHLKGLTGLQQLVLINSKISDAGLADLKGLTKLEQLFLSLTQITDAGLTNLEGLTELHYLDLDHTPITDAGLDHLKTLTGLRTLRLVHDGITDAGLAHLKGLTGLQGLSLSNTRVTDTGLEQLKGLTKLRWLMLNNTQISDEGLAHLQGLTGLEVLLLANTQVTDAGIQRLQQSLPKLAINRNTAD
jgi:beta-lactamase regulating signal transducer with metallopeptidase domain/Leucine-rich repeat (LRR) protein